MIPLIELQQHLPMRQMMVTAVEAMATYAKVIMLDAKESWFVLESHILPSFFFYLNNFTSSPYFILSQNDV